MTDTLQDTFSTFFSSEPEADKCLDCGTENTTDRTILWTTDDGDPQWVCPECKAARDEKDAAEEQRQADLINFALNMY